MLLLEDQLERHAHKAGVKVLGLETTEPCMRRSISIGVLDTSKSRHLMPNPTRITGSENSWSMFRCGSQ